MTLRKPIWTEGLFISEHHLQQQDQYHEELLEERLEALGRPAWGVLELQVDLDALAQGHMVLSRLRAILPDGSSVMQLAESIGKGLARAAVAGKVDGKVVDLSYKLSGSPILTGELIHADFTQIAGIHPNPGILANQVIDAAATFSYKGESLRLGAVPEVANIAGPFLRLYA